MDMLIELMLESYILYFSKAFFQNTVDRDYDRTITFAISTSVYTNNNQKKINDLARSKEKILRFYLLKYKKIIIFE